MFNIIKFMKESFWELRHKMSWPSYKETERFVALFFVNVVLWGLFLYGVNELLSKVQEKVYSWL